MEKVKHCDDLLSTGASAIHKLWNTISTLIEFSAVNSTFQGRFPSCWGKKHLIWFLEIRCIWGKTSVWN